MNLKPIRTAAEHAAAVAAAAQLMDRTDQQSVDQLILLQLVIQRWEDDAFQMAGSTAAGAILFRMDQLGLKQRDLVPYLGTKSRVSEILAGQRQPTVDQIRALNRHLAIPLAPLVGQAKHETPRQPSTASKAAIEKLRALGVMWAKETIDSFIARATQRAPALAMLRKSRTERTNAKTDLGALEAWCAGVLIKAEKQKLPAKRQKLDEAFAREVAKLSRKPKGPKAAANLLAKGGVVLVTLEHLPGTYLDGAAICRSDGAPVIGLTLRHDRIDNFWFTLLHELAHVTKHLGPDRLIIFDDLDVNSADGIEAEADEFARNALLPPKLAKRCLNPDLSLEELEELAAEAGVHPAVVAGRFRWEHGDYRRFSRLLGRGEVKPHFA